jgi:hypothetical protein
MEVPDDEMMQRSCWVIRCRGWKDAANKGSEYEGGDAVKGYINEGIL